MIEMETHSSASALYRIRVMIVARHNGVRQSLSFALATFDDLVLAGEAVDVETAIPVCVRTKPDVVLLDMMLEMNGIVALQTIRQVCPGSQIVALGVLGIFDEQSLLQEALQAGAASYLLKCTADIDQIATAIRAAHRISFDSMS
ncbi:MAG: response regulator transcription factor [Chloroflexi bacterium]|nr:response regulator transcription factor [Chloroflexota bacterium]MBU1750671.1 response regulator transcription factor [Chloroflexota bacterium]